MLSLYRHSAVRSGNTISACPGFLFQFMSSSTASPASNTLRSDAKLIGLVGLAHAISHFAQLVLPPLFPWLKDAFSVSYTELGAVLTVFFVVSCMVQAASGFLVDRLGPRPVL